MASPIDNIAAQIVAQANSAVQQMQAQMQAATAAFGQGLGTQDFVLVARILQDPVLREKVLALVAEKPPAPGGAK